MLISENIAKLIEEMLNEGGGITEIRRNDLAIRMGCVPSQVTYVISSRFTPERGFITESRRGGGGYIRIERIKMDGDEYLMHFFRAIGNSVDEHEARTYISKLSANEIITEREAAIISSSVSTSALERIHPVARNSIRADILRHVILTLLS